MFTDTESRQIFQIIDESRTAYLPNGRPKKPVSGFASFGYDGCTPETIVNIVNALLPLGKMKALAALDAYNQVIENQNLCLIVRALFNVPHMGYMPRMDVHETSLQTLPEIKKVPRYPLIIVNDVPILAADMFMTGDHRDSIKDQIDYFRIHGTLRDHPLRPTGDPLSIPRQVASIVRRRGDIEGEPAADEVALNKVVMNQILLMLGSKSFIQTKDNISVRDLMKMWKKQSAPLVRQKFRWSMTASRFVAANGKYAPRPAFIYSQNIAWKAPITNCDLTVRLRRFDRDNIDIGYSWDTKHKVAPIVISFYKSGSRKPLNTLTLSPQDVSDVKELAAQYPSYTNGVTGLDEESGTGVYIEVTQAKAVFKSPLYVP